MTNRTKTVKRIMAMPIWLKLMTYKTIRMFSMGRMIKSVQGLKPACTTGLAISINAPKGSNCSYLSGQPANLSGLSYWQLLLELVSQHQILFRSGRPARSVRMSTRTTVLSCVPTYTVLPLMNRGAFISPSVTNSD